MIMILTKEKQEALVDEYSKNHTAQEVKSFIDGMNKIIEVINENIKPK